jgi:hypothetical protein
MVTSLPKLPTRIWAPPRPRPGQSPIEPSAAAVVSWMLFGGNRHDNHPCVGDPPAERVGNRGGGPDIPPPGAPSVPVGVAGLGR